jgi:hypothetical protein
MEDEMGLFNRDDERYRNRGGYDRDMGRGGWDRVEQGFRGRDPNEMENRGPRDSGSGGFGLWGNARGGYDRDMSPTEAGWRGGGRNANWDVGNRDNRMDLGYGGSSNYDREMRGDDRNFIERTGDRIERGWNNMTGSNDYDRGYRGSSRYDSGYGMTGGGMNQGAGSWSRTDYSRDYGASGYNRGLGNDPGYRGGGYGNDAGYRSGRGYDRNEYKSRQQTDAGDPYGDRQSRTPIRMVNEDYSDRLARRNAYDDDVRRDRDWF